MDEKTQKTMATLEEAERLKREVVALLDKLTTKALPTDMPGIRDFERERNRIMLELILAQQKQIMSHQMLLTLLVERTNTSDKAISVLLQNKIDEIRREAPRDNS